MAWFDDTNNAVGVLTTKLATDASLVKGVSCIFIGHHTFFYARLDGDNYQTLLITSEYMNQVLVLIITFYAFHNSDMAFLCFCVYV